MREKKQTAAPHRGLGLKCGVAAAVCVLVALAVGAWVGLHGRAQLAIALDGQQIAPELFDQIMQEQVSDVLYGYSQLGKDSNDPDFWRTQQDGTTPGEALAQGTMQQLRTLTAMYDMAQETGTPLEGGVNGIFDRMEAENQSRQEKKAAGEPVYGLTEFTFETYLEYEKDWMERQYCAHPDYPGMEVTDQDRQAYYQQNRETAFKLPDGISFTYVSMDTNVMEAQQADHLTAQLDEVAQAVAAGAQLEEAAEQYPDLGPYVHHLEVEPDQAASYMDTLGDVLDLAYQLEPGQDSGVISSYGGVYLVQCTARSSGHYLSLEDVSDSIDTALRQQRYLQMAQSRGEALELTGDEQEILAYVIEQMTKKG